MTTTGKPKLEELELHISMPDGSTWAVPAMVIALDRARAYASEFDGSEARSLEEDTREVFENSDYSISEWAANNMNWSEVVYHARQVETPTKEVDYQEGWVNGDKEVVQRKAHADPA